MMTLALFLLGWLFFGVGVALMFGRFARVGNGGVALPDYAHQINCTCGRRRDGRNWVDPHCSQLNKFLEKQRLNVN